MKTAIIGGSGFLGFEIAKLLISQGHQVVIADRSEPKDTLQAATYVRCDITDMGSLGFLSGVEEAYNLAGLLGTSELETRIWDAVGVNVMGATNVFEACRRHGVGRLFYPSKPNVWRNVYTITKECSEQIAAKYNEAHRTRICSLRLFNAYGPRQHLTPIRKIVPVFAAQARVGLPIEIWGDGEQTVDLIYSYDIAQIVVDFTRMGLAETLDLGRGIPVTVNEVASMVNDYFGNKSGVVHKPMRPGETPRTMLVADISRLSKLVNLEFSDFKSSMRLTLDYYASLPQSDIDECLSYFEIGSR